MGNSIMENIGLCLVIFSGTLFILGLTIDCASHLEGKPVRLKRIKKIDENGKLLSTCYSIEVRSILGHWIEVERCDSLEIISKKYEDLKKNVGVKKPKVSENSEIISSSSKNNIKTEKI
jgi:hypothetical protein